MDRISFVFVRGIQVSRKVEITNHAIIQYLTRRLMYDKHFEKNPIKFFEDAISKGVLGDNFRHGAISVLYNGYILVVENFKVLTVFKKNYRTAIEDLIHSNDFKNTNKYYLVYEKFLEVLNNAVGIRYINLPVNTHIKVFYKDIKGVEHSKSIGRYVFTHIAYDSIKDNVKFLNYVNKEISYIENLYSDIIVSVRDSSDEDAEVFAMFDL